MDKLEKNIGIFILAAGESKRFGFPKFLFPYKGKPIIYSLFSIAQSISPENTYIISGAFHRILINKFDKKKIIFNPEYGEGLASSIRKSVEVAIQKKLQGVIFLLADQPFVDRLMIIQLINYYKIGYEIVAFEKDGKPSPPSMFSKRYYKQLLELRGDIGARNIILTAKNKKLIKGYEYKLEDFDNIWSYLNILKNLR